MSNKKGIALLIVVAAVIVLTILSSVMLSVLSNQTRSIEHNIARTKAKYATEAAMVRSLDRLRRTDSVSSVHSVSGSHDNPGAYFNVDITSTPSSSFPSTSQLDFTLDYDPFSDLSSFKRDDFEPPIIDSFTIDQSMPVDSQGIVTLRWKTTNATSVTISPSLQGWDSNELEGFYNIYGSPSYPLVPNIYTLTATGETGNPAIATVQVIVKPTATFSAKPLTISTYNGTSTLSWTTTNADSVSIVPSPSNDCNTPLNVNGSCTIDPPPRPLSEATYTYTLTATGKGGSVEKSIDIEVDVPEPTIHSFSANPTTLTEANCEFTSTLSWNVDNALSIDISPINTHIIVNQSRYSGDCVVEPRSTTNYILKATGYEGKASKSSPVKVEFHACIPDKPCCIKR